MPSTATTTVRPFPRFQLFVLATAGFISMTTEYLPGGLIPLISSDFDVPVSLVGSLVWSFAAVVVVTTLPSSWITRHVAPKTVIVSALIAIGASSLLAALAPSFAWLIVARVLGGLAHGLFWSAGASYAAHLVPPAQLGRATAYTAAGGAAATIAGVPIANLLGQLLGWRFAFGFIGALAVIAVIAVAVALAPVERTAPAPTKEGRARARRDPSRIPIALLCSAFGMLVVTMSAHSTYSVAWLVEIARIAPEQIPILLSASAIVGALGLAISARSADRHPTALMIVGLAGITGSYFALALARDSIAVVVIVSLLFGLAWNPVATVLQASTMRVASPASRSFAGALQTTTINIGIAGGALLGGVLIDAWGLALLPLVVGVLVLIAAVTAFVLSREAKRLATELAANPH